MPCDGGYIHKMFMPWSKKGRILWIGCFMVDAAAGACCSCCWSLCCFCETFQILRFILYIFHWGQLLYDPPSPRAPQGLVAVTVQMKLWNWGGDATPAKRGSIYFILWLNMAMSQARLCISGVACFHVFVHVTSNYLSFFFFCQKCLEFLYLVVLCLLTRK